MGPPTGIWEAFERLGVLDEHPGEPLPVEKLCALLREALGVEPTDPPSEEIASEVFVVGEAPRGGAIADVLLALDPSGDGLREVLAALEPAEHPVVLIALSYGSEVLAGTPLPRCIELHLLEETLVESATGVRASDSWRVAPTAPAVDPAVAVCITERGAEAIDAIAYEAIVARAGELDLFIDYAAPAPAGGYRVVSRRGAREARLTPSEAAALVELVERRAFVRPRDLVSLGSITAQTKCVTNARAKADEEPWLFFVTQPGTAKADLAYRFQPAPGLRYAVLKPVG
ncbi:MAG: hypothetical protein HYV09_24665 [Deltaproteobacteria bacterium]|nr:hypothetical protein [Deltaproteobacteria bacterium]